jgi:AcrR family transcriptional regulator
MLAATTKMMLAMTRAHRLCLLTAQIIVSQSRTPNIHVLGDAVAVRLVDDQRQADSHRGDRWTQKARFRWCEVVHRFPLHGCRKDRRDLLRVTAEVSPSTVYRYFGTKEGLIVSDEFEALSQEALADLVDLNDPVGSVRRIVANCESTAPGIDMAARAGQGPWRRVRYFFQEPSCRLAVYSLLDQASNRIAASMVTRGGMSQTKARVAAHALVFGYFAALEQWYLDGGVHPIAHYVDEGMSVLRDGWPQPAPR